MTDTDQPATTEARVVTTFRPGTVLADLARVLAELDVSCREQRETIDRLTAERDLLAAENKALSEDVDEIIDRLTGERDRARDLAARLEAEIARPQPLRCGCCGAARNQEEQSRSLAAPVVEPGCSGGPYCVAAVHADGCAAAWSDDERRRCSDLLCVTPCLDCRDEEAAAVTDCDGVMSEVRVSCEVAEVLSLAPDVEVWSSLTNYVGDRVVNPGLPPLTTTTRSVRGRSGRHILIVRNELDADGCRHYVPAEGVVTYLDQAGE